MTVKYQPNLRDSYKYRVLGDKILYLIMIPFIIKEDSYEKHYY